MSKIVLIPAGGVASMDPASSGFAHGFGLFETMRYENGQLYFWSDHWARLLRSAECFQLPVPEEGAVVAALREYVAHSGLKEAIVKISLVKSTEGSCLYVYSRAPLPLPADNRLLFDAAHPISPRSLLAGHKTHNYMEAMHLLNLARARGYSDALRVDTAGCLAETTTANFFFIQEGRVLTPSLKTGILPGITRAALLSSGELDIEEGAFGPDQLKQADAAFTTNSTGGVRVIQGIDGLPGGKSLQFKAEDSCLRAIQKAFASARAERALQLI